VPGLRVTARSALSPGPISLVCCSSIPLPSILSECTTPPTFTALNTYVPGLSKVMSDGSKLISVSFTWIVSIGPTATASSSVPTVASCTLSGSSLLSSVPPPPQPTRVAIKRRPRQPSRRLLRLTRLPPVSAQVRCGSPVLYCRDIDRRRSCAHSASGSVVHGPKGAFYTHRLYFRSERLDLPMRSLRNRIGNSVVTSGLLGNWASGVEFLVTEVARDTEAVKIMLQSFRSILRCSEDITLSGSTPRGIYKTPWPAYRRDSGKRIARPLR